MALSFVKSSANNDGNSFKMCIKTENIFTFIQNKHINIIPNTKKLIENKSSFIAFFMQFMKKYLKALHFFQFYEFLMILYSNLYIPIICCDNMFSLLIYNDEIIRNLN